MTDRHHQLEGCFFLLIIYFTLLLLMCSCTRTQEVVVERVSVERSVDTIRLSDTLCILDSVLIKDVGDTVYKERWRVEERVKWRDITRVDTIIRADSIYVATEPESSAWDKFRLRWFNVLAVVALALLAWVFRQPLAKIFSLSAKTG